MRKRKLLAFGLAFCLGLSGVWNFSKPVFAAEAQSESQVQSENTSGEDHITSMDEEGNIKDADSSAKLIENPAGPNKSRSGEPQVVNFRTKNNAITEFIEQETAKQGYTNGAYGADAVYLGSANGKYKFMLSGVVGWVKAEEVQVVNLSQAKAVSCYEVKDGKLMHHIVQDMTTPGYATSLNNGPAPSYLTLGTIYYSYDGHYFYTDYGVMAADYRQNQRTQSVNPQEPYYNYFQYLPMRSQSGYTGEEINGVLDKLVNANSKMKNTGETFVKNQNTYGVHALLMTGIAANESNWGKSSISQKKNNLFGLNATDAAPGANANQYSSVEACIEDFANGWMSRGYLYPGDYRYQGGFLGNKASGLNVKYASDPYWGEKAANIAWRLDSTLGSKDAGAYTLAAKEIIPDTHISVNVRKEQNVSSTLLYKTGKAANYVVLVRNEEPSEGFYEIQSDAVLDSSRSTVVKDSGKYDFEGMYGYMSSDYLTVVSRGKNTQEQAPDTDETIPPEKQLESIAIANAPSKVSYIEGESFDGAGMQVLAKWSDGTESDVTGEVTWMQEALNSSYTEMTVQYTWQGVTKEAVQPITVAAKAVEEESLSLAVTPGTAELKPGESQQFGVEMKKTADTVPELKWEVLGSKSQQTVIDSSGLLTLGQDETAEKMIVRLSWGEGSDKVSDAMVTLVKEPEQENQQQESTGQETTSQSESNPSATDQTPEAAETDTKEEEYIAGQQVNGQKAAGTKSGETSDKQKNTSVKTGDASKGPLWITILSISGFLAAGMGYRKGHIKDRK